MPQHGVTCFFLGMMMGITSGSGAAMVSMVMLNRQIVYLFYFYGDNFPWVCKF
jgi:hypothetical protein